MRDRRLEDRLRRLRAPDEGGAEERAWRLVDTARREHRGAAARRRAGHLRAAAALGAVLIVAVAAFTPPGEAVADWVEDVFRSEEEPARPALSSLPARGRLLVTSAQGAWIVERDGSKRLLAGYGDASWSPRALFVVATRGREIVALEPKGRVRWSIARRGIARLPRWSPSGFRIAYMSGRSLRVVAGDGTGDRLVARGVDPVAPAWRPGERHRLAFVDADGGVRFVDADSGREQWRARVSGGARQLEWTRDGRRLLVRTRSSVEVLDRRGEAVARYALRAGAVAVAIAPSPAGGRFALVVRVEGANRSEVLAPRLRAGTESGSLGPRLFSASGRFSDVAWSPDGLWLLVPWRDADQWLFIRGRAGRASAPRRLIAVSRISDQFHPGAPAHVKFPEVDGWCCP